MTKKKTKAPSWTRFPGAAMLQAWASELKKACAAHNDAEWRDVGRAVVLVADSESQAERSARRVAMEAGMNFVTIDAAGDKELPPHADFYKQAPAMVWLEPDDWMEVPQDNDSPAWSDEKQRLQERFSAWIEEFDPKSPVVVVTACPQLDDLSGRIDRPGVFDRYFALPPTPLKQMGEEFIDEIGVADCAESLRDSLTKVGKWVEQECGNSRRRELALLYLRRLKRREKRPLEFLDLMHLATHGYVEEAESLPENEEFRRSVAAHEAGHAAMAILDSNGKNIPDYCSIVPGADFKGVVADSMAYRASLGDRTTYADFRHQIRVGLAGRAAEELVFGPENVSSGACGDLESAWKRSTRAFGRWGFAPDMTSHEQSASNLAVVVGDPSDSEQHHVEGLVRTYLRDEYNRVYKVLEAHRPLVEAIIDRLMWDPIVDQNKLLELSRQHGGDCALAQASR
jgi:cell division protease FtsH